MTEPFVTVGKIFIDSKGAGRIYLRKKVVDMLDFKSGEEVRIEVYPKENKIVVTKL